jgi:hypothetical protein
MPRNMLSCDIHQCEFVTQPRSALRVEQQPFGSRLGRARSISPDRFGFAPPETKRIIVDCFRSSLTCRITREASPLWCWR